VNTALKVILGLVTVFVVILPIIAITLLFWYIFSIFSQIPVHDLNPYFEFPTYPTWLFPISFLFVCATGLQVIVQGFYIVHNIVNKAGSNIIRSILGLGTFFLPFIALPVYYCIYILPKTPPVWALTQAPVQLMAPAQSAP
jgi:hypothetical protein